MAVRYTVIYAGAAITSDALPCDSVPNDGQTTRAITKSLLTGS